MRSSCRQNIPTSSGCQPFIFKAWLGIPYYKESKDSTYQLHVPTCEHIQCTVKTRGNSMLVLGYCLYYLHRKNKERRDILLCSVCPYWHNKSCSFLGSFSTWWIRAQLRGKLQKKTQEQKHSLVAVIAVLTFTWRWRHRCAHWGSRIPPSRPQC